LNLGVRVFSAATAETEITFNRTDNVFAANTLPDEAKGQALDPLLERIAAKHPPRKARQEQ
jgi:hypothetical protein